MVTLAATTNYFPTVLTSSSAKASLTHLGPDNLDVRGFNSSLKSAWSKALKVTVNAQASPKLNGTTITSPEGLKIEEGPSPLSNTIFNPFSVLDSNPRKGDMLVDHFVVGKLVQGGLVFRQNFSIRSYDIGIDGTASIESLMNYLQETALNHGKMIGFIGFGSTPGMSRRDLIWVISKMTIVVDRYPTWGDVIQVDNYIAASGKNGMRHDWIVRDWNTGEILARASSVCVMMNKNTRKLSKMPDGVRGELEPRFMDCSPVAADHGGKLVKLDDESADYLRSGLTPRWSDLDVNQHVNNVKYIGWILESAPLSTLANQQLCSLTLEYRKECGRDSVLQSLTSVGGHAPVDDGVECNHLLQLEGGPEIVRGRTKWRPKILQQVKNSNPASY